MRHSLNHKLECISPSSSDPAQNYGAVYSHRIFHDSGRSVCLGGFAKFCLPFLAALGAGVLTIIMVFSALKTFGKHIHKSGNNLPYKGS